jgi:CheY-like chemotaxis protein
MLLTKRGHRTCVAHDGVSALQLAAQFDPEIAVLDLGLPVMDGYELAERLLASTATPKIRLIALTGYGQAEDRARTRAAGFDAHLVKPVNVEELEAALNRVAGEPAQTAT